jgi:superfamily II DNA/RNA helicase
VECEVSHRTACIRYLLRKELVSKASGVEMFQSIVFVDSVEEVKLLFESLSTINDEVKIENLVLFIEEGMGLDERAEVMSEFRYN